MDRLEQNKKQALEECCLKIRHWKKFRADYDALKERLISFSDKLCYDIMVPFGPHAFMPGKLVHTNSITVLLGENWFTEMSTKQAVEFLKRRIKQCDTMLQDLEKEKKQFSDFLEMTKNIAEEHYKDIQEFYDDKKLENWREEHKKNIKLQKQREAKERAERSSQDLLNNDDYWSKLENLELENLDDDLQNSSLSETEEDSTVDSEIEDNNEIENDNEINENKDDMDNSIKSMEVAEPISPSNTEKHVRWVDLSEARSKCITFTHSKTPSIQIQHHKKKNKRRRRNSSTSDFDEEESESPQSGVPLINSPSDIYKCFSFSLQPSKPKSILKSSTTNVTEAINQVQNLKLEADEFSKSEIKDTDLNPKIEDDIEKCNILPIRTTKQSAAFTGEVKEHFEKTPEEIIIPSSRPKSLFQRSKQGTKA